MKLAEQAAQYAREHPQKVTLAWVDNSTRTYPGDKAVKLCADRCVSGHIVGAEAQDKILTSMLNALLDNE